MNRYSSRASRWTKNQMREAVQSVVLAEGYDSSELDDIRLDVYLKLTGKRNWPDYQEAPNSQILSVLNEMANVGTLVKTGGLSGTGGYRSRSPVHFRTPAAQTALDAEREARREARQQLQDAWLEVRTALSAKLNEDVRARSNSDGQPDLDLDTWQEVLRLMT